MGSNSHAGRSYRRGHALETDTVGITAFAREQPERCRELHEISGQLMNRVKIN